MQLSKMISNNLILFDENFNTKKELLNEMINRLVEENIVTDSKEFFNDVMKREAISPTGIEKGLAIPHGKSRAVKRPILVVAKLKNSINDWESINPDNKVSLVFLLAIPESEGNTTHLEVLSELSTRLLDDEYIERLKKSKSKEEFIKNFNGKYNTINNENSISETRKKIVAITACATGIAHTYLSAEYLERAGREMGIDVVVERQGANGLENELKEEQIRQADALIIATDVAPKKLERFKGLKYVKTRVAEPLKNSHKIIEKALSNPDGKVDDLINDENVSKSGNKSKNNKGSEILQAIMTGVSYMIPILVAGGLMIGISKIGALIYGGNDLVDAVGDVMYATHSNSLLVFLHYIGKFGSLIMKFMYPVFAGYVSYSLADKNGLVPGFIGGAFAGGLHFTFWGIEDGAPSGFFGALILGLVAGYLTRFVNKKIKLSKDLQPLKPMLIVPFVTVLSVFLLNFYLIDPVFGSLNNWMFNLIADNSSSQYLISSLIAGATAFDLGGPINKAAHTIAYTLNDEGVLSFTSAMIGVYVPAIGLGLATIIDKLVVKRRVFDEDIRVNGKTSFILGFLGISEGAIPFAIQNPLITIPINMIGSIIAAITALYLNGNLWYIIGGFWGWPLMDSITGFLIALAVGVIFVAIANILVRNYVLIRNEKKNKNIKNTYEV